MLQQRRFLHQLLTICCGGAATQSTEPARVRSTFEIPFNNILSVFKPLLLPNSSLVGVASGHRCDSNSGCCTPLGSFEQHKNLRVIPILPFERA